jgi:hypothetical protein
MALHGRAAAHGNSLLLIMSPEQRAPGHPDRRARLTALVLALVGFAMWQLGVRQERQARQKAVPEMRRVLAENVDFSELRSHAQPSPEEGLNEGAGDLAPLRYTPQRPRPRAPVDDPTRPLER